MSSDGNDQARQSCGDMIAKFLQSGSSPERSPSSIVCCSFRSKATSANTTFEGRFRLPAACAGAVGGATPPGEYPCLTCLFSLVYDFKRLQNIHSRWVTGKIFFLNELSGFKMEKPRFARGFSFSSVSSIAVGGELLCHVDLVDWHGVRWVGGLTGFWGFLRALAEGERQEQATAKAKAMISRCASPSLGPSAEWRSLRGGFLTRG